jgi:hypothetical protein
LLHVTAYGKRCFDWRTTLKNSTDALPFPLEYGGKKFLTVEDASVFVLNLSEKQRELHHWRNAHTAFTCALMEPAYLKTAVIALQLALTLDALVHPTLLAVSA